MPGGPSASNPVASESPSSSSAKAEGAPAPEPPASSEAADGNGAQKNTPGAPSMSGKQEAHPAGAKSGDTAGGGEAGSNSNGSGGGGGSGGNSAGDAPPPKKKKKYIRNPETHKMYRARMESELAQARVSDETGGLDLRCLSTAGTQLSLTYGFPCLFPHISFSCSRALPAGGGRRFERARHTTSIGPPRAVWVRSYRFGRWYDSLASADPRSSLGPDSARASHLPSLLDCSSPLSVARGLRRLVVLRLCGHVRACLASVSCLWAAPFLCGGYHAGFPKDEAFRPQPSQHRTRAGPGGAIRWQPTCRQRPQTVSFRGASSRPASWVGTRTCLCLEGE